MNLTQRRTPSGSRISLYGILAIFAVSICSVANAADPLVSWNEGAAKKAILDFVAAVTDKSSKDYVEPAERIATFDNDGVSGGGIAFMRPITEKTYAIPPEQVVGSSVVAEFQVKDGKPAIRGSTYRGT